MKIDYNQSRNRHTLEGPRAALPEVFRGQMPRSLLDVGCGTGTWLKAALELGVSEVVGVDGMRMRPEQLLVPWETVRRGDLRLPCDLGRRFDAVLCLEVAEHLAEAHAETLLDTLVRHSDTVVFSAACPGQPGQHHVNLQWPEYWQALFNERGYACSDEVRWRIWGLRAIEPWYRQNLLVARRDPAHAGKEPRIACVIHPEMMEDFKSFVVDNTFASHAREIAHGRQPANWYLTVPFRGLWAKVVRRLRYAGAAWDSRDGQQPCRGGNWRPANELRSRAHQVARGGPSR